MNKTSVFISRALSPHSILRTLSDQVDWHDESLIEFGPKPFVLPSADTYEWIFFYSKNGIVHFFNQLSEEELQALAGKKLACMGSGTARTLKKDFNRASDFTGNGSAQDSVDFFKKNTGNILFIKAENSLSSVENELEDDRIVSVEVYTNRPKTKPNIPHTDICILTSPLNAEVYLSSPACRLDLKVIAIGPTTNQYLMQRNFFLALVPDTPSEKDIYNVLKALLNGGK